MSRQSITFTDPNDVWLSKQVESQEYASRSDVVNDLIRNERKKQEAIERIREALIQGESSGVSDLTPSEMMENAIDRKRKNGEI